MNATFSEKLYLKDMDEVRWFQSLIAVEKDAGAFDRAGTPLTPAAKMLHMITAGKWVWGFTMEIHFNPEPFVWFGADKDGSPDQVAELIHQFFQQCRPEGSDIFSVSWASQPIRPVPGTFGGGAYLITKDAILGTTTWEWIAAELRERELTKEKACIPSAPIEVAVTSQSSPKPKRSNGAKSTSTTRSS